MTRPNTIMANAQSSRAPDLRDVMHIIGKRKWVIIVPFLIVVGAAVGGSFLLTPEYESKSIVSYRSDPNLIKPLSALTPSDQEERMTNEDRRRLLSAMTNEIISVRSLSRLITDLRLDADKDVNEKARKAQARSPGQSLENIKLELLLEELRGTITVDFAGRDQLLLTVSHSNPQTAQKMAARLTEIFIEESALRDLGSVRDAQQLTDDQLSKYDKLLQSAVDKRNETEREYLRLQTDTSVMTEDNRRTISAAIDELRSEIINLEKEVSNLGEKVTSLAISEKAYSPSRAVDSTRDELEEDGRFLVDLMGKYPWKDRIVVNATIQMNATMLVLENLVARSVEKIFAGRSVAERKNLTEYFFQRERVRFLRTHQSLLQASFNKVQRQAQAIPETRSRLAQTELDVTTALNNREMFRQQETSNQLRQDIIHANSRYRIIEPARAPLAPARPDKVKIGVMGAILGVILGAAAALVAEIVDASFRRVQDVEHELGIPVLATVPKID